MFGQTRVQWIIVVLSLVHFSAPTTAQQSKEALAIGFFTGASVPSESVSRVYEALDTLSLAESYRHASNMGMHIGARVRFGLSEKLSFTGSAAFCRFAQQDQTTVLKDGRTLALKTATTFVPLSAGITAFVFRGLISPYVSAEATYTYETVTIATGNSVLEDLIVNSTTLVLEPSDSRIGGSVAAGVQLDIGGLMPFVELRNNWVDLFDRSASEQGRSFFNISIGLLF